MLAESQSKQFKEQGDLAVDDVTNYEFLDPLTSHSSLLNTTYSFQWTFDLRYNVSGQPTGRPQCPGFVARSKQNSASELRDWKVWKQFLEQSRFQVANSPHVAQYCWRSDNPYCA